MNKKYIFSFLFIGFFGLGLMLIKAGAIQKDNNANSNETNKTSQATQTALTVQEIRPQKLSIKQTISANGAIAAWNEIVISPEIGGYRLSKMLVEVGDVIVRGQKLAMLADSSVRANVRKQQAEVELSAANLLLAQSNLKRAQSVEQSGAIAPQKIDEYQNSVSVAQATLQAAKASLANVELNLRQTEILADDDGTISAKTGVVGNVVNAGSELYRLVRQGKIEWQAELDATQIANVAVGQSAKINLPNGKTIVGTVRLVEPTLSKATGRGKLYVSLPAKRVAQIGLYVSGEINIGEKMALAVPQSAVVLRDGRSYVYRLDEKNSVYATLVKTGHTQDDMVEIREGVNNSMRVVASGGAFLSDGVGVKVSGEYAIKSTTREAQ